MSAIDDLTTVPDQPQISEGNKTFSQKTFALWLWIRTKLVPAMVELRDLIVNSITGAYSGVSSSSVTVADTGEISITTDTGRSFKPGTPVRLAYVTDPRIYIDGITKTYNASTGAFVFYAQAKAGSGTYTSWSLTIIPSGGGLAGLGSNTFVGAQYVPDDAYDSSSWSSNLSVPTKKSLRDKFESLIKNIVDSGTAVKINRQNSTDEGGQLELARAVDNATGFYLDVTGNDTLPILRVVAKNYANSGAEAVIKQSDSYGAEFSPISGASGVFPEFKCRGFCNFSGVGSISIRGTGNVLGIARIGLGDYEVTLATSMPDQAFACPGSATRSDQPSNTLSMNAYPIANNKIKIFVNRMSGGANERVDCDVVSLSIFR